MKKIILMLAVAVTLFTAGCGTTNQSVERNAYKATETMVLTADAAMKIWAQWYVTNLEFAQATGDLQKVAILNEHSVQARNLYHQYQLAATAVIVAQMAAGASTNEYTALRVTAGLTAASLPLITFINNLVH